MAVSVVGFGWSAPLLPGRVTPSTDNFKTQNIDFEKKFFSSLTVACAC